MSFVDADVLKSVIGPVASGPAGFGVNYEVAGGANIVGNSCAVEVKLNEQSLTSAQTQLEGGENKEVAKTLAPPKASGSLATIAGNQGKADSKYLSMFASAGMSSNAERGMAPGPRGQTHRHDYRSAMAAKNPLLRIRQRQLLQLRKTFDEISALKKKSVVINAENLPQHLLGKMAEAAISKGIQTSALGPAAKIAKAAGYNPAVWKKWGNSLMDGSFPSSTPRPRAS
ncbi:MAG: hypothetical protein WCD70_04430 [Alphaproteobacteria bacterium]